MRHMTNAAPTAPARDAGRGGLALLIIDMMNDFDFRDGDRLREKAASLARPIIALRDEVEKSGGAIAYVNDNFGEWQSQQDRIVARALAAGAPRRLAPRKRDYFIIKPQFSGFYATNLAVLLPKLATSRLILAGVAADICVLFTAADAHMRDYSLWIPEDVVASSSEARRRAALEIMQTSMGAEIAPTSALSPAEWTRSLDASEIPGHEGPRAHKS
jgi:nicotinamidase-related amidase